MQAAAALLLAAVVFAHCGVVFAQDYPVLAYYSDSGCAQLAGMKYFVNGAAPIGMTTAGSAPATCKAAMACLLEPAGAECAAIKDSVQTETLQAEILVSGAINETENGNVSVTINATSCTPSGYYAGCRFRWVKASAIAADPAVLYLGNTPVSPASTTTRTYIAYYDQSNCQSGNLVLSGFVSGETRDWQRTTGLSSCAQSMPCVVDFDGPDCQALARPALGNLTLTPLSDTLFDEFEDGVHINYTSSQCTQSSSFGGCYFRYLSVNELAVTPNATLYAAPPASTTTSTTTTTSTGAASTTTTGAASTTGKDSDSAASGLAASALATIAAVALLL